MKPDHERVTKLLTDTVTLLCKNGLLYDRELRIQGLLGITVDSDEVFLVSINDSFSCSSESSLTSVTSPVANSAASASSLSRNRSGDDIVDLTRLVETPTVFTAVQPPQLSSSISPMQRGTQPRPRSAGSISQANSQSATPNSSNVTLAHHHSHPVGRQPPAERLALSYNQHSSALALVESSALCPRQRPHAGYIDNIGNLMMACERQLAPRGSSHGQYHRQLPHAGTSGWSATDQHHSMQHRPMHQNMAVGDLPAVGRRGTENIRVPPPLQRQPVVPITPGSAYVQRSDVNTLHYMHTRGVNQPTMLSRQPVQGVPRQVYANRLRYFGDTQQAHAAAEGRQLQNTTADFQPPAKRHAPNHLPRQAVQSCNPAFMHGQLPHPHGRFQHSHSIPFSQQMCPTADPLAGSQLPLCDMPASHASCVTVTSSPAIKPPSSPVQSGRRSRPRQVEHIDLCGDDDVADAAFHIPVSSIVIQPDNTDFLNAPEEAETLDIAPVNTTDLYNDEFATAPDTSLPENYFPPLSQIHEIVPLDDGLDNDDGEVAAGAAGRATSVSFSVTNGMSDGGQNSASNWLDSAALLDRPADPLSTFPHSDIVIDSQLARLSADESQQMTALCFDTEGSDMHAQT